MKELNSTLEHLYTVTVHNKLVVCIHALNEVMHEFKQILWTIITSFYNYTITNSNPYYFYRNYK